MATQSSKSIVSETSICSRALTQLGQNGINSLDDLGDNAEWMRVNYPGTRDAVLEGADWTFAVARDMSTSQDLDEWGVMYKHPKPLNWLVIRGVYKDISPASAGPISGSGSYMNGVKDNSWLVEGDFILSNESTIYMWGIQQITNTAKFSSLFVEALVARLAADAAGPLVEDNQKVISMWGLYEAKRDEAGTRDGQQGSRERLARGSLVKRRFT